MKFFTGIFDKRYLHAGLGLTRSFKEFMPDSKLEVFTDMPELFGDSHERVFKDLYSPFGKFYYEGSRRNVFKLTLFQQMQEMYPGETICWIDSDSLVLSDLTDYLVEGKINVIVHGRRASALVDCGKELLVKGVDYTIGGMYSIPPDDTLEGYIKLTNERRKWSGSGGKSGDQVLLNHLVKKYPDKVNWVSRNTKDVFNLSIAQSRHPRVGDPQLARIKLQGNQFISEGRRVALFYWIMNELERHRKNGFGTFEKDVANRLKSFYKSPVAQQVSNVNAVEPKKVKTTLKNMSTRAKSVIAVINRILPNQNLQGAEIGVWRGETSKSLLHSLPNLDFLWLVDPWCSHKEYHANGMICSTPSEWDSAMAATRTAVQEFGDRVGIVRDTSLEAAKDHDDGSLDFVFIDANHAYKYVAADIKAWVPKLKDNGILVGHDWQMDSVRKAVQSTLATVTHGGTRDLNYVWWVQAPRLK